jgi:hypothetical protein
MKQIPELDKIFNISAQEPAAPLPSVIHESTKNNLDQQEDYELARSTLRNLIYKSESTLDEMIELAKSSEHPRTYEVAGQLIKTVSDVAKDLLTLQKQVKDLNKDTPESAKNITNNNVVFAGSTNDLMKILKNNNGGVIDG